MERWQTLEQQAPEIAEKGRGLLYQFNIGLGYLATQRADGGLRLHPFCPVVTGGGVYGLIIDSPKRRDLLRRKRYAIHAFGPEDRDDEFMLAGEARQVEDPATVAAVSEAFHAMGAQSDGDELCIEFLIDRAFLALYPPRAENPHAKPRKILWHPGR